MRGPLSLDRARHDFGSATAAVLQILDEWEAIDWFVPTSQPTTPPSAREFTSGETYTDDDRHRRHRPCAPGRLVSPARSSSHRRARRDGGPETQPASGVGADPRSAEALGLGRCPRQHSHQLAHRAGPDAPRRLRHRARASPPDPPRPHPRLLGHPWPRDARLSAHPETRTSLRAKKSVLKPR